MKMKQRFLLLFSAAGSSIETSTETPLETLGKMIEELCLKGKLSELEDYAVSERLTVEEAGLLAGQSQLLNHLSA